METNQDECTMHKRSKTGLKIRRQRESSEPEFAVQKIVGKRVRNGCVEYLLKWKGYSK